MQRLTRLPSNILLWPRNKMVWKTSRPRFKLACCAITYKYIIIHFSLFFLDSINSVKDWTSNRKRKLRDRNVQKHTEEDNEYEKISSPSVIAAKAKGASKTNLKYLEPDKKFFDYFPIEDVELNYDPKEDDIRVVLLSDDDDTDGKKKKSKKFTASTLMKKTHPHQRQKRDVQYPGSQDESATSADGEGGKITKRNVFPQYLSSNSIPGADCNYIPQSSPNFPWFPRPSRFYLPVVYVPVPVFQGYVPRLVVYILVYKRNISSLCLLRLAFPYE